MRTLRTWLAVLLTAGWALSASMAMAQGQRVALVMGNATYTANSVPRLANPLNDAADVAGAMRRLGFAVTVLTDGPQGAMRRALRDFGRAAEGADQAIVFFAGHGIEMGGENWLLPVDVEMRAEGDVQHEAIRLRDVMETVARARSLGLVILDACRDDPFRNRMLRSAGVQRSVSRGLGRVEPARSAVLVAYAARDGSTAADGTGRNSPYTTALLRHLGNTAFEVADLFREVHDDVVEATRGQQQPAIYGQMGRQRVFLAGVAPGAARPPQPAPPQPTPMPPPAVAFPAPVPAPVRPSLEDAARTFAEAYYSTWSGSNDTAMAFVRQAYAPSVTFFGNPRSAAWIADYKRPFTERWPVRRYAIRPASLRVDCNDAARSCVVEGLVDWDARAPSRDAVSIGLASFTLGMVFPLGQAPLITSETSSVIERR
jgi:hypothetical protein